ncbi:hypothetical protein CW357_00930 [Rummeliibacillus sp. TYF005]|uniref:hypothetical protein n=1 Tax=Rummeliibacillus sp. TYF005 TaxID=2058214 RepID=UPI000F538393|nr:hypothetical protein [Rummeliibacillus sp. TYF005]RPJ97261.1 hypothetical protein CW357_00930 [Rummeliibacillus sp. TYF005]
MSGWISLHRKLMDNPIYSSAGMLKLWIHCLLKASHAEHEQLVGTQIIKLQPGQFVTGRDSLAYEFNRGAIKGDIVSSITLWRWLGTLEKMHMVNIKKTTKYSVVTVINWSMYQLNEQQMNNRFGDKPVNKNENNKKSEQQITHENAFVSTVQGECVKKSEQQMNNKRTTNEQQMNTNNNVNNVNNNISRKRSRFYEEDSDEMKLANFFISKIRENDQKFKDPNKQTWCDDFRKLIELDKRDKHEISKLIKWVQQDDFWKSNVLSPSKLRKRYSELLIKMQNEQKKRTPFSEQNGTEQMTIYKPLNIDYSRGED